MMNSSRTTHAFRLHPLNVTFAALAPLLLALVAPAGEDPGKKNRAPDLGDCRNLQVPAGNKVAFHAYAEGVQIYRWDGASWTFVAPEAVLFTRPGGGVVGTHYAGPTWESTSGSTVAGAVMKRCEPDPTAIPWLLLRAASTTPGPDGGDRLTATTYIQRVNTTGGLPPTSPCDATTVGAMATVPYTSDYYFYRPAESE